jgi:hypothetical protein
MPWQIERDGSALHVRIDAPMVDEWELLMDEIQANLVPKPLAIYVPSRIEGATETDAGMLILLWQALGDIGILVLPPP